MYWYTAATELLPSAAAHAQLGIGMLRSTASVNGATRRLAAVVAESALLTARLAFQPESHPGRGGCLVQ
jgi:hypothetical protein